MLKTFKYPIVHFPFNKILARICGEADISSLSFMDLNEINFAEHIEEINPLLLKFVKYITPMISGEQYLVGASKIMVSPRGIASNSRLQSGTRGAISVVIPITSMFGSNSFNIEEPPFSRCYSTLNINPGSFVIFDGCVPHRDDLLNATYMTSMFIYFELLPKSLYPNGAEGYV